MCIRCDSAITIAHLEVKHGVNDFVLSLAQPQHDAALGVHANLLGGSQHRQRLEVACARIANLQQQQQQQRQQECQVNKAACCQSDVLTFAGQYSQNLHQRHQHIACTHPLLQALYKTLLLLLLLL
jgi:hypothetical protein